MSSTMSKDHVALEWGCRAGHCDGSDGAKASAVLFRGYLQTGTIDAVRCRVIDASADMATLGPQLTEVISRASDVLLAYYTSHGLLDDRGRLYLGLTRAVPSLLHYTALPMNVMREEMENSPAAIRILILDCCFPGRAIEVMADDRSPYASPPGCRRPLLTSGCPTQST
ncbi:hypothetical protein [Streptomyces sp. CBMA123]|uniref:hypothetical protein n=1 Tax=Streptomyces sp. CBMA123 TaxID=1896313 RepID=UPI001661E81E|nr:hypothetical protein [Streptomyces sp. CBMA123]MBD0695070.1 hypothetical protein [Streptomyces sp. CBMA123]